MSTLSLPPPEEGRVIDTGPGLTTVNRGRSSLKFDSHEDSQQQHPFVVEILSKNASLDRGFAKLRRQQGATKSIEILEKLNNMYVRH
jgi:hypothetical protein